jgi:hypothetical protein
LSTSVKSREKRGKYLNWDKHILPEVLKQLRSHKHQQIDATIRGLLYIFESTGDLMKKDYGQLSKHLVKWRENEQIPSILADIIVDNTRRIRDIIDYEQIGRRIFVRYDEKIQTLTEFITPFEHIRCGIDYLKDAVEDFHKHIPLWLNQTNYVEVWVEKNAMASVIYSILNSSVKTAGEAVWSDNGVKTIVAPNGGWSSYTFAKNNLDRLLEVIKTGRKVFIQYYGDSDPSGERMTAEDSKMVKLLTKHGINFERIAINEETINDFRMHNLKIIRDPNVRAKLEDDPNYAWFTERHHGQVWQIEIDALQLDLGKFKKLVLSNIKKHFEPKIHRKIVERVMKVYSASDIHKELKEQVKGLQAILDERDKNYEAQD